jgi:hypothetical protein
MKRNTRKLSLFFTTRALDRASASIIPADARDG